MSLAAQPLPAPISPKGGISNSTLVRDSTKQDDKKETLELKREIKGLKIQAAKIDTWVDQASWGLKYTVDTVALKKTGSRLSKGHFISLALQPLGTAASTLGKMMHSTGLTPFLKSTPEIKQAKIALQNFKKFHKDAKGTQKEKIELQIRIADKKLKDLKKDYLKKNSIIYSKNVWELGERYLKKSESLTKLKSETPYFRTTSSNLKRIGLKTLGDKIARQNEGGVGVAPIVINTRINIAGMTPQKQRGAILTTASLIFGATGFVVGKTVATGLSALNFRSNAIGVSNWWGFKLPAMKGARIAHETTKIELQFKKDELKMKKDDPALIQEIENLKQEIKDLGVTEKIQKDAIWGEFWGNIGNIGGTVGSLGMTAGTAALAVKTALVELGILAAKGTAAVTLTTAASVVIAAASGVLLIGGIGLSAAGHRMKTSNEKALDQVTDKIDSKQLDADSQRILDRYNIAKDNLMGIEDKEELRKELDAAKKALLATPLKPKDPGTVSENLKALNIATGKIKAGKQIRGIGFFLGLTGAIGTGYGIAVVATGGAAAVGAGATAASIGMAVTGLTAGNMMSSMTIGNTHPDGKSGQKTGGTFIGELTGLLRPISNAGSKLGTQLYNAVSVSRPLIVPEPVPKIKGFTGRLVKQKELAGIPDKPKMVQEYKLNEKLNTGVGDFGSNSTLKVHTYQQRSLVAISQKWDREPGPRQLKFLEVAGVLKEGTSGKKALEFLKEQAKKGILYEVNCPSTVVDLNETSDQDIAYLQAAAKKTGGRFVVHEESKSVIDTHHPLFGTAENRQKFNPCVDTILKSSDAKRGLTEEKIQEGIESKGERFKEILTRPFTVLIQKKAKGPLFTVGGHVGINPLIDAAKETAEEAYQLDQIIFDALNDTLGVEGVTQNRVNDISIGFTLKEAKKVNQGEKKELSFSDYLREEAGKEGSGVQIKNGKVTMKISDWKDKKVAYEATLPKKEGKGPKLDVKKEFDEFSLTEMRDMAGAFEGGDKVQAVLDSISENKEGTQNNPQFIVDDERSSAEGCRMTHAVGAQGLGPVETLDFLKASKRIDDGAQFQYDEGKCSLFIELNTGKGKETHAVYFLSDTATEAERNNAMKQKDHSRMIKESVSAEK